MEDLLSAELTIVELLLLVSVVAMFARWIRIPYTVVLVLVGLLLSFSDPEYRVVAEVGALQEFC